MTGLLGSTWTIETVPSGLEMVCTTPEMYWPTCQAKLQNYKITVHIRYKANLELVLKQCCGSGSVFFWTSQIGIPFKHQVKIVRKP
jgi:hypothetical protein